jgi:hypothetical protein
MLNVTEIDIKKETILSALIDKTHITPLVKELVASHLEALAIMDDVSTMLWLAEDRGVATISVKEIVAKLEGKTI